MDTEETVTTETDLKTPTDSISLKKYQETLRSELNKAITGGDAEGLVRIRSELQLLSLKIKAAQISETKKALDIIEKQFGVLKEDEFSLIDFSKAKNAELMEAVDQHIAAQREVNKVALAIDLMRNNRQELHEQRRALRGRLSELKMEVQDEKFESTIGTGA